MYNKHTPYKDETVWLCSQGSRWLYGRFHFPITRWDKSTLTEAGGL